MSLSFTEILQHLTPTKLKHKSTSFDSNLKGDLYYFTFDDLVVEVVARESDGWYIVEAFTVGDMATIGGLGTYITFLDLINAVEPNTDKPSYIELPNVTYKLCLAKGCGGYSILHTKKLTDQQLAFDLSTYLN